MRRSLILLGLLAVLFTALEVTPARAAENGGGGCYWCEGTSTGPWKCTSIPCPP
jgi:hypothetical protein